MTFPTLQPILWGSYYKSDPAVLQYVDQLFVDLVAGPYMNAMAQYGVRQGVVQPPIFIDVHKYPAPTSIWNTDLQTQLLAWFKDGAVPAPAVNQVNLLYFILPPTTTTLKYPNGSGDPIGNGVQGWHSHTKYHSASTLDDTIWGTVKTNDRTAATPLAFLQNCAQPVGHECIEAFNDPFDDGRKELGDPCVSFQYTYKGIWPVQTYWSIWDNKCIQGELPPMLPRSFQLLTGYQEIFVLGHDGKLWLEQAPFGTVPPARKLVDTQVITFQALDFNDVAVLGSDQNLWMEKSPFGTAPPARSHVDANVLDFQAFNTQSILVLGTDRNLWFEHAPFGNIPPARQQVDANVATFEAVDQQTIYILGTDLNLWLATGPFGNVPPARKQVDANVRNFAAVDHGTVFVLGMDGHLWLETAPFSTVPPSRTKVDSNVLAMQATSSANSVWVLRNDATLWLETAPYGTATSKRTQIDATVQAFQAIDTSHVLVLGTDGALWLEAAPFGSVSPSRQLVDRTVT
jgi:hypothetical protein